MTERMPDNQKLNSETVHETSRLAAIRQSVGRVVNGAFESVLIVPSIITQVQEESRPQPLDRNKKGPLQLT